MSSWNCPHCQGSIGSIPKLAGQVVACPYCCGPVLVPARKQAAQAAGTRRSLMSYASAFLFACGIAVGLLVTVFVISKRSDSALAAHEQSRRNDDVLAKSLAVAERSLKGVAKFGGQVKTTVTTDPNEPARVVIQQVEQIQPIEKPEDPAMKRFSERLDKIQDRLEKLRDEPDDKQPKVVIQQVEHLGKPVDPALKKLDERLEEIQDRLAQLKQEPSEEPRPIQPPEPFDEYTPGLGVGYYQIAGAINRYCPAEFNDSTSPEAETPQATAHLDGADIVLFGYPEDLQTITVVGGFYGDDLAKILASIVGEVMPSWNIADAGTWFTKAVERCDDETFVSTLKDGIELTVIAADEPGVFWIFFQRDA